MNDDNTIKYKLRASNKFKKHLKLAEQRRKGSATKVLEVVNMLVRGQTLAEQYRDHALTGSFAGLRECHVLPDLLLIYSIHNDILILELIDTGTHSNLFKK